jgi:type VI protein secretion system component VasF
MIWLIGALIVLDVILEVAAFVLQEYKRGTVFQGLKQYSNAPNQTEMQKSLQMAALKLRVTLLRLLLLALMLLCWGHSLQEQTKPLVEYLAHLMGN